MGWPPIATSKNTIDRFAGVLVDMMDAGCADGSSSSQRALSQRQHVHKEAKGPEVALDEFDLAHFRRKRARMPRKVRTASASRILTRQVPSSTSAKRAKLAAKRAEKRSPDDAAPKATPAPARRKRPPGHATDGVDEARRKRASGIESRFLKLPKALADALRLEYSQHALQRPIDPSLAYMHDTDVCRPDVVLTVPRRPKWRFDASKKVRTAFRRRC